MEAFLRASRTLDALTRSRQFLYQRSNFPSLPILLPSRIFAPRIETITSISTKFPLLFHYIRFLRRWSNRHEATEPSIPTERSKHLLRYDLINGSIFSTIKHNPTRSFLIEFLRRAWQNENLARRSFLVASPACCNWTIAAANFSLSSNRCFVSVFLLN